MRECGECTLCCELFEVKWLNKPRNTPCIHCDKGCLIQETKPSECRDFDCAWLQSEGSEEALRPDRCGIVFEKLDDDTFYGTVDPKRTVSALAKRQVLNFIDQGYTLKLSQEI